MFQKKKNNKWDNKEKIETNNHLKVEIFLELKNKAN